MKKLFFIITTIAFTLHLSAQIVVSDSVTMGGSYANDVYYSLKNGSVAQHSNTNWHLAFRNGLQTDGVFINSTAFVNAYLTNADTTQWSTIDSSNATTEIFNTDTNWNIGALNRTMDNPYSSWGIYNTLTHKVIGDSLYILKVAGNWMKLWVVEKDMGKWKVRIANTNGNNDTTFIINSADFKNRLFAYVNVLNNTVINNEPADSTWDIKFTRYAAYQPMQGVYYPSTGVLSNSGIKVAKVTGINKVEFNDYTSQTFVNNISTIGSDWKSFDNGTFRWKVADSTVYFIKVKNGDVYKMYFTGFTGQAQGKSYFNIEKLYTTGIAQVNNPLQSVTVYPNPASNQVNVVVDSKNTISNLTISLVNINGQKVIDNSFTNANGFNNYTINTTGLNNGIYFVMVTANGFTTTQKLVIAN